MNNDELKERTKKFALRCIRLAYALQENKIEQHIRTQLVHLATSCAISIRSAGLAEKPNDQLARYRSALEEIDSCCFWIECIIAQALKKKGKVDPLLAEALELRSSISQIINGQGHKRTAKKDV
jgi:four helix bundle protein